jgi:deoxycytidylate deaminase
MNLDAQIKWHTLARCYADMFSQDPDTRVGCAIISPSNRLISLGTNNPVSTLGRREDCRHKPLKYGVTTHAEAAAILEAKRDLTGCSAVMTDAPCSNCLRLLLESNIYRIYYGTAEIMLTRSTTDDRIACRHMLTNTYEDITCTNIFTQHHYAAELHQSLNQG